MILRGLKNLFFCLYKSKSFTQKVLCINKEWRKIFRLVMQKYYEFTFKIVFISVNVLLELVAASVSSLFPTVYMYQTIFQRRPSTSCRTARWTVPRFFLVCSDHSGQLCMDWTPLVSRLLLHSICIITYKDKWDPQNYVTMW